MRPRQSHDEDGSALAAVLVLVVAVSLTVGAVLTVDALHLRIARHARQRLQARLSAEEGLARAMAEVAAGTIKVGQAHAFATGVDTVDARLDSFGGFLLVRVHAQVRHARHQITALLGNTATGVFEEAVVLTDPRGGLTLADTARVNGRVRVGTQGLHMEQLGGRQFRGHVPTTIAPLDAASPEAFDLAPLRNAFNHLRAWSQGESSPLPLVRAGRRLDASYTLRAPCLVVLDDSATIAGPLRLPPFTAVVSQGTLVIEGDVRFDHSLVFTGGDLWVRSGAHGDAQLLAEGRMHLQGNVRLTYPSIVATMPKRKPQQATPVAALTLGDSVHVDGLVLGVWPRSAVPLDDPYVLVAKAAHVRGAVVTTGAAEFAGHLGGTLMAYTTRLYRSPTLYVGWLSGAVVTRAARPDPFVVPFGLEARRLPSLVARRDSLW